MSLESADEKEEGCSMQTSVCLSDCLSVDICLSADVTKPRDDESRKRKFRKGTRKARPSQRNEETEED